MKHKICASCSKNTETAYRIQAKKGDKWIFICKSCLPTFQGLSQYRYGGTWKGYRH